VQALGVVLALVPVVEAALVLVQELDVDQAPAVEEEVLDPGQDQRDVLAVDVMPMRAEGEVSEIVVDNQGQGDALEGAAEGVHWAATEGTNDQEGDQAAAEGTNDQEGDPAAAAVPACYNYMVES